VRPGAQLLLLTVAGTAAAYARATLNPLQESVRIALALSDNQMALLQGVATALPVAFAAPFLGLLIDRCSRVRLLLIFAVVNLLGSILTAMTSSFVLLFFSRCLVGLASTATNPTAFSLLADLYAPERRGRATMIVATGNYAGMSAAFLFGGVLLSTTAPGIDQWRWAMAGLACPLVPVMLLILVMREPPRSGVVVKNPSTKKSVVELWRLQSVIAPVICGIVLIEIGLGAALVWTAPAFSRGFNLSPNAVGVIVAAALVVSGVFGPIAGGVLADRCQQTGGPRRTMRVLTGLALLAAPSGLFPIVPRSGLASVVFVAFITIASAIIVMGSTLLTVVNPNELRGLCMSLLVAAAVLFGVGLSPVTVSLLSGALGGPAMIGTALALVAMATCGLSAAAFGWGIRSYPALNEKS
jgi:MFS family permease